MKRKGSATSGAMLDLWRPAADAGDPVGCLATTYTFTPGIFDEQCLARFLEIGTEPDREDLAFLLERENRLGGVYAGVMVDHTQAGVEHSLRWDVLPVRVPGGKQHAKISLLAWERHVRIIVTSANLTVAGYRTNHEVASALDLTPARADTELLDEAIEFLRRLVRFVPAATSAPPEVRRALTFLDELASRTRDWARPTRGGRIRRRLIFTVPGSNEATDKGSLRSAVEACRSRGGSPTKAWIASPFFDDDGHTSRVTAALCKLMARGVRRELTICVPGSRVPEESNSLRLLAPRCLLSTPPMYDGIAAVHVLPEKDPDENPRFWHAKMLAFRAQDYSALMVGSSNFTCAGMGVGSRSNAEANLLTIVDRVAFGREAGELEAIWPDTTPVDRPESANWLARNSNEDEQATHQAVPRGFLSVTYYAGDQRRIVLELVPNELPASWSIHAVGHDDCVLLADEVWRERGAQGTVSINWAPVRPPEKVMVRWEGHDAFLPINVENSQYLPAPASLDAMTSDDMLLILAASDPSAMFRVWARRRGANDDFDVDVDSATPVDLDPLRRYDLQATFLHRTRRRARILARLRENLQRPVWGRQVLDWKLQGLIGIEPLANRLISEFTNAADGASSNGTRGEEALLTLSDFLIVLREVDYQPTAGSLPKRVFEERFRPFLKQLAERAACQVAAANRNLSPEVVQFWERVVIRCQG